MNKLIDSCLKTQAKRAIAEHLATEGPQNWSMISDRFPTIPQATLWRYIRAVRTAPADNAQLVDARRRIAESLALAPAEERLRETVANLPATPSPDYVAKSGRAGVRRMDLLGRMDSLFADAEMLRDAALGAGEGLENGPLFAQSITVRERLVRTTLDCVAAIWDLERTTQFYEAIVAEVAAESPAVASRIIARLKQLNEERGFSAVAGP